MGILRVGKNSSTLSRISHIKKSPRREMWLLCGSGSGDWNCREIDFYINIFCRSIIAHGNTSTHDEPHDESEYSEYDHYERYHTSISWVWHRKKEKYKWGRVIISLIFPTSNHFQKPFLLSYILLTFRLWLWCKFDRFYCHLYEPFSITFEPFGIHRGCIFASGICLGDCICKKSYRFRKSLEK